MGPLMWWWRWWLGDDPNRDRQLTEARDLLDEQRTQADELADRLQDRAREIAELRAHIGTLERAHAEADDTRAQLTSELEHTRAEADDTRARLTSELEHTRAEADDTRAQLTSELQHTRAEADDTRAQLTSELQHARAEADDTNAQLTSELEHTRAEIEQLRARLAEAETTTETAAEADPAAGAEVVADASTRGGPPNVEEAREVLGSKVTADDLTVVEGVGPKIAGLLSDAGIDSWRALAEADVERLRLVLAEAGPRYRLHDPSTWPTQGKLLAEGRWQDFKDLVTG